MSSHAAPVAWGALGFLVAAGLTTGVWMGCQRPSDVDPRGLPPSEAPAASAVIPEEPGSAPIDPVAEQIGDDEEEGEGEAVEGEELGELGELDETDEEEDETEPEPQKLAASIVPQASIFPSMEWDHSVRLGYVRMPSKVAVDPTPIKAENCTAGWYRVLSGGYICGRHITFNHNHASVRLGVLPDLEALLPYQYGFNKTMGTPLYRSVPSKEEMLKYEPYLNQPKKAEKGDEKKEGEGEAKGVELAKSASKTPKASDEDLPWWQPRPEGTKVDVRLTDLAQGADSMVARRLVRGFFVSIERTFPWNGRHWHKTTEGHVTPADRFTITKAPTFQGVELEGTDTSQPVGFILVAKARKYEITTVNEKPRVRARQQIARHSSFRLTGEEQTIGSHRYLETTEGWWTREKEGTSTEPYPMPAELLPGEKWIDVNLSRQTLVAYEGETPIFATLVSTGLRRKTHETPMGSWRIQHKHLASRMSGNGTKPGESPYSIDDVPYAMFYEGSYAVHGAFWHNGFGRVRSRGCTNLAPHDAKRLFFWADPPLPEGWHGIYATEENPGTLVVVHD